MIRLDKDLTKPLLPQSNEMVLVGQEGRMFLLGGETVLQSAGRVLRRDKVVAAADMLAAMHQALERRGIRLVVALPPNASTIYQEELPGWARNPGRQTEYDLLLELLTARGVKAVDLRPALRAARKNGPTYFKYDTHWTARGALAGFNSIVEADAHPEWRIDPESGALAMANRKGGDLARMYGVEDRVEENVEELTLPSGTTEELTSPPYPTYVQASNAAGPTIMVIGDSFTEFQFARMLRSHAGRVVWLYYNRCEFDWTWVDRFHPDEVWWAPTERFLICDAGAHPTDFAG